MIFVYCLDRNVTNTDELRAKLNSSQSFFNRHLRTDSDSEVWALSLHHGHLLCCCPASVCCLGCPCSIINAVSLYGTGPSRNDLLHK